VSGLSWSRRQLIGTGVGLGAGLALRGALGVPVAWAQSDGFDADVGLDPGHSRFDVGASGAGVGEYQLTLDIAQRIKPLLEEAGLRVNVSRADHEPLSAMSRSSGDERTRIEQAARIAAVGNVRIYVSIHFNGGPPSLRGTETYYNGENAGPESRRLAEVLQRHVVAALNDVGYATADRGAKEDLLAGKPYGHFFSLRGGMPSALVEGLFLSNPTEGQLLHQEETREALARGYVGGIVAYFAGG
jgi:N-acetylmuramoyl-L-alanine amidase